MSHGVAELQKAATKVFPLDGQCFLTTWKSVDIMIYWACAFQGETNMNNGILIQSLEICRIICGDGKHHQNCEGGSKLPEPSWAGTTSNSKNQKSDVVFCCMNIPNNKSHLDMLGIESPKISGTCDDLAIIAITSPLWMFFNKVAARITGQGVNSIHDGILCDAQHQCLNPGGNKLGQWLTP